MPPGLARLMAAARRWPSQVRALAAEAGLRTVAGKKSSTGICFIGKRKFGDFISEYALAVHRSLQRPPLHAPAKVGRDETRWCSGPAPLYLLAMVAAGWEQHHMCTPCAAAPCGKAEPAEAAGRVVGCGLGLCGAKHECDRQRIGNATTTGATDR